VKKVRGREEYGRKELGDKDELMKGIVVEKF
jgi:hypothetical protein